VKCNGALTGNEQCADAGTNSSLRATDRFYFSDNGLMAAKRREWNGDTENDTDAYAYDANGNRTQDERGAHAYNARDQLAAWTQDGETTRYELDGLGGIRRKWDSTTTTNYTYVGDRLTSAEATTGTLTETDNYCYSEFGNGNVSPTARARALPAPTTRPTPTIDPQDSAATAAGRARAMMALHWVRKHE